ncbi:MAG TPA: hypothetical protein VFD58_31150 [Blastocatellia bacterium]|nr:hypothetical protein [Blastocatellia bacterium]
MTLIAHCGSTKMTRAELIDIPTPEGTRTHQPVPHYRMVEALLESLSFRRLAVVKDEYAVTPDGMRMFGALDLETGEAEFRFSIGIRNSNDKSMRLAMTVGYKVCVCDNMAFRGDFTPVLHKHTRRLDLAEVISLGVDRIQRGFEPLRRQIACWKNYEVDSRTAKEIIYDAFLEGRLAPRHLMPAVHWHYFKPEYREFEARTFWSLSNAFTSAFKALKPVQQFQATARLGDFLRSYAETDEPPRSPALAQAPQQDHQEDEVLALAG